jgi:Rho GTPase-activating protein RGD1
MEKAKSRFDSIAEELERVVVAKEGESIKEIGVQQGGSKGNPPAKRAIGKAVAKGGLLLKGRNPANVIFRFTDTFWRLTVTEDAAARGRRPTANVASIRRFSQSIPRRTGYASRVFQLPATPCSSGAEGVCRRDRSRNSVPFEPICFHV